MKSKVSPTAIGIFIAGAIVIIFASVILFGSGKFFRHTKTFMLTFREPVTGLEVGAPVKLLGVSIGSVKEVSVGVGNTNSAFLINVRIEVDREHLQDVVQGVALDLDNRPRFEKTVKDLGLRARLEVLSLLSGQLYIALDVYPGQPGFQLHQENTHGYWEIPTLPSTQREMMQSLVTSLHNLTELDFKGLSTELKGLLTDLRTDLAQLNFGEINTNLVGVLGELQTFVGNPALSSAITNLDRTLAQLDELGQSLNKNVNPLLVSADADLKKAGSALDEATQALRALKEQFQPGSDLTRQLIHTLDRVDQTLNAVRQLAQELERNPGSLISGKKESKP
jgi:paraquat-inducible protein B